MSKKLSFLEKLTGGIRTEEPDEIEKLPRAAKKTKKLIVTEDENPEINTIQEKDPESWLPEVEGQLTVDVYETPDEIVIKSTIAGVDSEDLDVTITNDMVTIKGERLKEEEIKSDDIVHHQECYWGIFSRTIILPADIDAEKSEASLKNGILTIRLPKIERVRTKRIKIKAA